MPNGVTLLSPVMAALQQFILQVRPEDLSVSAESNLLQAHNFQRF